jgi:HD-GYP domain-containing protein (c-di-GMP phosphodiesterase class II)
MRFRTRVFLFSFVPFAVLVVFGFWMVQGLVQTTVRGELRSSMRENHIAFARVRSKSDLQNSRFLSVVGENPALKAGMNLLKEETESDAARLTVEDQLRELCTHMNFDLLYVSAPDGSVLTGVMRDGMGFVPVSVASRITGPANSLLLLDGRIFEVASIAIDQADENIGSLSVGEFFSLSEFATPSVLVREGRILQSSVPKVPVKEIETALVGCGSQEECDVRLRGRHYISLPIQGISLGDGYGLRTLQDLDSATEPLLAALRRQFLPVSLGGVLITLFCSIASARTVVKPITEVIAHLRHAELTGVLPELKNGESGIREIRDLMASFNRAAVSVRDARERLQNAYVQFVGSLANALDARDRYTAGHSWRVSRLACATAETLKLEGDVIDRIRIGALLHDIGKIGIDDEILRKPGRLTDREVALLREHPVIGRRILEGVQGFSPFLSAVEFHHENWDGTGYPRGQSGEETPIEARIIHVADAYDAMTTDRPYRRGMSHDEAMRIVSDCAGTQFDPRIVEAFSTVRIEKSQRTYSGLYATELTI